MMIVQAIIATFWSFSYHASTTHGFLPSLTSHRIPSQNTHTVVGGGPVSRVAIPTTRLFENKLWDRMEIEEDEEPMWYVLNCVAGLEIDLLRQCRQRCEGMEDVVKFVVPMVTNTRSHGANRMVKDIKVKYQGYVFAKLRLCPKTYEAIQGLDLCRSWMGTINYKGIRKLPPAPVALNDEEIENFGLEDCEDTEETESDDDIIVDTAEADEEAAEFEETIQKVYLGLRVNDMVKVTAKNKFYDEDAIVRRLKDGKVFLRFYTYGSMYEEWMDPGNVRKLSNIEILKGLSGPQQPITQRDIDGPDGNDRGGIYDDDGRPGDRRRPLQDSFGGGPRNRRQDRTVQQFRRDADRDEQQKGEDNWNWYKENERREQPGGYKDGEFEIRGSERNNQRLGNRDDAWTQGDVDSQWGRTNQREKRQEKRQPQRMKDDGGDWSAFVSPSKQRLSKGETDDFFASLMTDLSNDLNSERRSTGPSSRNSKSGDLASLEDDFFASLISEIEQESSTTPSGKEPISFGSDEDDFFSSLVDEIQEDAAVPKPKQSKSPKKVTQKTSATSDDTDFFQSLAEEIESSSGTMAKTKNKNSVDELDDFFSDLVFDVNGESDDFFGGLETTLDSELSVEAPPKPAKKSVQKKDSDGKITPKKTPAKTQVSTPAKTIDVSQNLDKCTVPELKEMLREKGLKVTGKKSELIDRLTQS